MNSPADIKRLIAISLDMLPYNYVIPNTVTTFNPETEYEYLKVSFLESGSQRASYGSNRIPSILQVDVVRKLQEGILSDIEGDIMELFPFGLTLESKGAHIRFDGSPTISAGFEASGRWITVISIPYEVYR